MFSKRSISVGVIPVPFMAWPFLRSCRPGHLPVSVAKHALECFPCRTSWKIVGDDDFVDLLIPRGDTRVCPRLQLVWRNLPLSMEDYGSYGTLAPFIIGNSVNGDFPHRRMLHDYFLDILRKNVDAAGDDHVFLAIHEMKETVRVSESDVAGVQPSVDDCLRCEVGPLVITGHEH